MGLVLSSIEIIREEKRAIIRQYARSDDVRGLTQVLIAMALLALVWSAAILSVNVSLWLTVPAVLLISFFSLRVFVLMHECGHGSLFRSQRLNRVFGFVLGVLSGMPQYVWSQHHQYHHAHNGDWQKYRGPYATPSVDEYTAMTSWQQFVYRAKCSVPLAPLVGFIYLVFNPRFTWLNGSIGLVNHLARGKLAQPNLTIKEHAAAFETRYWQSRKQYWHMFWNNVVLLGLWFAMCRGVGALQFFAIYLSSISLAGAMGFLVFTVQHNFKHSYASDTRHWDYDLGAIEGTSFLVFPRWLNWFTANIGYHHIHHLSSRIPNYHLVACHNQYRHLFTEVARVKWFQVPSNLKYILWDEHARRIISVAEYKQQMNQPAAATQSLAI